MAPEDVLAALERPPAARESPKAVPTGSLGLDLALGGGWPGGKVCELYGGPGTGKTRLAYHAAARATAHGPVLWLDSGGFDPQAATAAGANLDQIALYPPEDAANALRMMADCAGSCPLMVLDTITGLDEGAWLRGLTVLFAELARLLRHYGGVALFTSNEQVSELTTGVASRLLREASAARVHLTRCAALTRAQVVKNVTRPPADHQIRFLFRGGRVDHLHELVTLGLDCGVLYRNGVWVTSDDTLLGQGIVNAARWLRSVDGRNHAINIREAVIQCLT